MVVECSIIKKGWRTERLAATFVESAESAGKNVTLFHVEGMNVAGCRGCNRCFIGYKSRLN